MSFSRSGLTETAREKHNLESTSILMQIRLKTTFTAFLILFLALASLTLVSGAASADDPSTTITTCLKGPDGFAATQPDLDDESSKVDRSKTNHWKCAGKGKGKGKGESKGDDAGVVVPDPFDPAGTVGGVNLGDF